MSQLATPLPLTGNFFPNSPTPPVWAPYSKRVALAQRTTGAAGSTDTFFVPIPSNAIALTGGSVNPVAASMTNYAIFSLQSQDVNAVNAGAIFDFAFSRGSKSAWGCYPLDPQQQYLASVSAVDATVSYVPVFYFLVQVPGVAVTLQPQIPFQPNGGPDEIVSVPFTSAANTAQTVDFTPIGNVDLLEILSANFYTSAGTATGNFGLFDGTTRVDIDSTAAVASYAFNVGKLGSRAVFGNQGQSINLRGRFVIGAAGVGNTTTLNVVYRAGVVR